MTISLSYWWLTAFLLAFARALPWLMTVAPFSSRTTIPTSVTVLVASGLALLVAPLLPRAIIPTTFPDLLGDLVFQVLTGAALGYIVNLLLSAVSAAGGMLDLLGGLNLPPAIDPLSLQQSPLLGQFYDQVAVVLLFLSGGYLYMIEGFIRSFSLPGYSLAASGRVALVAVTDLATFFDSALEIAAPVLVVLFATQIVLGMLSKAAPQINVWIMGMPLQIFLSLIMVALTIGMLSGYLENIVARILGDTTHLFSGA